MTIIKKLINRLSIRNKILFCFYSIIVLVTVLISIYYQKKYTQSVVDTISQKHYTMIQQLCSDITFIQNDLRDISTYLCIDKTVQSLLEENQTSSVDSFYNNSSLSFIYNLIASKSYISSVIIYSDNETPIFYVFTDGSSGISHLSTIKTSQLYQICYNLKGKPYWHRISKDDHALITNNIHSKLALSRIIINHSKKGDIEVGFMTITFNEEIINQLLNNVINENYERFVIYSSDGNIIYEYGRKDFFERDNEYITLSSLLNDKEVNNTFTENSIISNSSLENTDWQAFYIADKNYYTKSVTNDKTIWLFIILACFCITFPISLIISAHLSAPIKNLLYSMKKFQNGNLEEQVPIIYNDEIGELSQGYNKMVNNIRTLINDLYVLELREREAELKALQAQINPHFLYNSLDTIYWKALSHNENDIGEMVFSLSKMFRLSLNRGNDLIRVDYEIELVNHYLILQKMRFQEKLKYEIIISEEIKEYLIPKLIIQPFVENAIVHGIEPIDAIGIVQISGYKENDYVVFTIIDNGVGINNLKINDSQHSGYAITNIKERLSLIYEKKYILDINSQLNKGTTITIKLPYDFRGIKNV